jgi:hypothetical protein
MWEEVQFKGGRIANNFFRKPNQEIDNSVLTVVSDLDFDESTILKIV